MFAPAVPQLMAEFHSSNTELAAFVVSIYVLGFAIGPLVIGLSLNYMADFMCTTPATHSSSHSQLLVPSAPVSPH